VSATLSPQALGACVLSATLVGKRIVDAKHEPVVGPVGRAEPMSSSLVTIAAAAFKLTTRKR
jgi:hypothetical protein